MANHMFVAVDCNICESTDKRFIFQKDGFNVVQCKRCGLVYVSPRLSSSKLAQQYSKEYYSDEYYTATSFIENRPQSIINMLYRDVLDDLACLIGGRQGNLLDLGCGVGNFLNQAKQMGWIIAGIDISPFAVNYARNRLQADVRLGDISHLPIPDESFDAITTISVIEHIPDPKRTINEISRLLKKDGVAVISTINFNGISNLLFGKMSYGIEPDEHIYYFTPKTLEYLLTQCRFELIKIESRHIYLYNFFYFFSRTLAAQRHPEIKLYRKTYDWIQKNTLTIGLVKIVNKLLRASGKGDNLIAFARKV